MNEKLVSVWREAWRPPDRRSPWAWAEAHVSSIAYSPIPGRFRSNNSPQIREPLEALIDPRVRLVFIIAAIQSGKTSVGELGLCHSIANLPGPTLWLDQTDDDAKDQAESRLHKLFEDCAPVKSLFPSDRHKKRNTTIHFRNGMTRWVLGVCKGDSYACRKTTMRFVFVPLTLFFTPQQFAVFVNDCELIITHSGFSPTANAARITSFSRRSTPLRISPTSNAINPSSRKTRLNSRKDAVIRCNQSSNRRHCHSEPGAISVWENHIRSQLSPT
jgi:hypothetical protein